MTMPRNGKSFLYYSFRILTYLQRLLAMLVLNLFLQQSVRAQNEERESSGIRARIDLPFVDAPFNSIMGLKYPSMRQSLSVSKDAYQLSHAAISAFLDPYDSGWKGWAGKIGIGLFDILSADKPFFAGWAHEEWHRAAMARRGISSHNDIYDFYKPGYAKHGVIAVSHEKDEDLVYFKANYPAEHIRMSAAGWEAQAELSLILEKDAFFYGVRSWNNVVLWFNALNNVLYFDACSSKDSDEIVDALNAEETEIANRDFTGFDCTAWVYDLHRPNERYADRGEHITGIGIDRYIKYTDLTHAEKNYLNKQKKLSLLNFLDPFLFDVSSLPWPVLGAKTNVSIRHLHTSFGSSSELAVFAASNAIKLFMDLHLYMNQKTIFPGIDLEVLRHPLTVGRVTLTLSPKIMVWQQPKNQLFETSRGQLGGLARIQAGLPISRGFEPYLAVEGKTVGWVAGNVYLDRNISAFIGMTADIF